ncbi:MAG: type VI secretion system contractile sheath domain-containing protein [Chitinispirillaceae bacterium]
MTLPSAPVPRLLPWRMLVVGDFSPKNDPQGPYTIDDKSLKNFFETIRPSVSVSLQVDESGQKSIEIEQIFRSIRDFHPGECVMRIPFTKALMDLRVLLQRVESGELQDDSIHRSIDDLSLPQQTRSTIQRIVTPRPSQTASTTSQSFESEQNSLLDNISSMMDLGGSEQPSSPAQSGGSISSDRVSEAIALLDKQILTHLETILSDGDILDLEATWRALKLIADNTDFRSGVTIEAAACDRENLVSFLREEVYSNAWKDNNPPVDAIVLLHPFGRSPVDLSDLDILSQMSQAVQVPLLAWAGPAFFGVDEWKQVDTTMPSFQTALSGTGYEKFRAFRQKPQAQWLALATNALFGRTQYDSASRILQSILSRKQNPRPVSRDSNDSSTPASQMAIPTLAASAATLAVINRTLSSIGDESYVDNRSRELPDLMAGKNQAASVCVWNGDKMWELTDGGILPLSGSKTITGIRLGGINTCAENGGSLIQVLISSHLSRQVLSTVQRYGTLESEQLSAIIAAGLREFFGIRYSRPDEEQLNVAVTDKSGSRHFYVRCVSPVSILGEEVSFDLQFEM